MGRQSDVEKNPRGNQVFKTRFPSFFMFFTWSVLLLCFFWVLLLRVPFFFVLGLLSFSAGAFLLLHHGFLSSSCSFWSVLLLCFFWVLLLQVPFSCVLGFLSFSTDSFLLLHHGFLSSSCSFYSRGDCSSSSSVGHFVFFSSSISDLLQFFKFVFLFYETRVFKTRVPCGKNISMSAIDLESLRLDFLSNSRC